MFHAQSPAEQRALYYTMILPGDDVSDRWLIELLTDDLMAGKIAGIVPPGYASLPDSILHALMRRGILARVIDTPLRRTVTMHQVISERLRELLASDPTLSREIFEHSQRFARRNHLRACQWTQATAEAASFADSEKLITAMAAAGFDPNGFRFSSLLTKASGQRLRDFQEAGEPAHE